MYLNQKTLGRRAAIRTQQRQRQALRSAPARYRHERRRTSAWYDVLAQHQEKVSELTKALESQGIRGLKAAASKSNVKGYGKMTKARLVRSIVRVQLPHPAKS